MKKRSTHLLLVGVLAFLVGTGIVLSTMRGSSDAHATDDVASTVLVAREPIPAGTPVDELVERGLVSARELDGSKVAQDAITDVRSIAGRVLAVDVAAGEQVRAAQLRPQTLRATAIDIPQGKQGVAVQLPFVAGGAGYVGAGDRVNVYGNLVEEGGQITKLVLANVEVLDVSTEVAPRVASGEERVGGSAVTYLLALDPHEAERVIFLAANAQLWFALTDDPNTPVPMTSGRRTADILS